MDAALRRRNYTLGRMAEVGFITPAAEPASAHGGAPAGIGGHRGSRSAKSLAIFDTEVKDLLKRIADGRPGISGPRFPKAWKRMDYCAG